MMYIIIISLKVNLYNKSMKRITFTLGCLTITRTDVITLVFVKSDTSTFISNITDTDLYNEFEEENLLLTENESCVELRIESKKILITMIPINNIEIVTLLTEQIDHLTNRMSVLETLINDTLKLSCIENYADIDISTKSLSFYFHTENMLRTSNTMSSNILILNNHFQFTPKMKYLKCERMTFHTTLDCIEFDWKYLPTTLKSITIFDRQIYNLLFEHIKNIDNCTIENIIFYNCENITVDELNILKQRWPDVMIMFDNKEINYEQIEL